MKYLYFVLLFLLSPIVVFPVEKDDLNLSSMMQPADSSFFFKDDNYYYWCNSVVKGDDGKYHLFYARWPKKNTFFSWLTRSEIAHAVSDMPYGPYKYMQTVLKSRPGKWDAISAHNVQVNKFDDRYFLYYTSTNSGDTSLDELMIDEIGRTGYSHKFWGLLRSNQRAGVAVADKLEGPWKRKDYPMVEPQKPIYTVAVNPSVCRGKDGKYYMIIKGDNNPGPKRYLIQAVGTSVNPDGPFVLESKPAFADIPTEDVCIWYDKIRERFYAVFHAHGGNFIGLITSEDGINWNKANNYVVCKKEIPMSDGTILKVDRMERPYVYLENGVVRMLSFAVKKGNSSFIVFFECK